MLLGGARVADPLKITVLCDAPDENWPSMDLAAEMLLQRWGTDASLHVEARRLSVSIPPIVRRMPWARQDRIAMNADRAIARYIAYPIRAAAAREPGRLFLGVADHSYAHLVHALPGASTGVYCTTTWTRSGRSFPRRRRGGPRGGGRSHGCCCTACVRLPSCSTSTREVGRALESHGLVPRHRLVRAPYGVSPEFDAEHDAADGADAVLSRLEGRPFVLHVGSGIARKRLDVLFEVFARLRARHPGLCLVQQGATLSAAQRTHVDRLGIGDALVQPPRLERRTLAGLYRRASLVLVTSDAEGFGFPVIEAMACGAMVLASDLSVLKEVGEDAALYAPVGDVSAWTVTALAVLDGSTAVPSVALRLTRAAAFTWDQHARTILEAYRQIDAAAVGRAY